MSETYTLSPVFELVTKISVKVVKEKSASSLLHAREENLKTLIF